MPPTLPECQALCHETQSAIRLMEKTAVYHWQHEQRLKYEAAVSYGDTKLASAIKHQMATEQTKHMYAKIRQLRGETHSGITRILAPLDPSNRDYDSCVEWITIDTPAEVEARLLQQNRDHFGQADGSFPTIPPFLEWVDWQASTHVAELILAARGIAPI